MKKASKIEHLINLLATKSINYHDFIAQADYIEEITSLIDVKNFTMWNTLGLPIIKLDNGKITLKSRETNIDEAIFCVVDIETSGGIKSGQVIEIGALKMQNGKILDKFESFIKAPFIPENIIELTGITLKDLDNAPHLNDVLAKFRLFLGDSIFVAHNVKFDYNFLSISMQQAGFGILLNRPLCTINLARRTIPAQKYGLSSLKELLGIENAHHRAFNDALSACEILKICLQRVPWNVQSVEDLIEFSKSAKTVKIIKEQE
ncbi:MAG: 3'-5' exonuclease [Campylobacter sp.]|nr:3'-5' exonuclease [Campylobacter sp.]